MSEIDITYEDVNQGLSIRKEQDVSSIVEYNKEMRQLNQFNNVNRFDEGGMIPVATIPFIVIEEWCSDRDIPFKDLMDDPEVMTEFNKWLNSDEALLWRTSNIQV